MMMVGEAVSPLVTTTPVPSLSAPTRSGVHELSTLVPCGCGEYCHAGLRHLEDVGKSFLVECYSPMVVWVSRSVESDRLWPGWADA